MQNRSIFSLCNNALRHEPSMGLQEGHGMVTVENEAEQLNWSVHETATQANLNQLCLFVCVFSV